MLKKGNIYFLLFSVRHKNKVNLVSTTLYNTDVTKFAFEWFIIEEKQSLWIFQKNRENTKVNKQSFTNRQRPQSYSWTASTGLSIRITRIKYSSTSGLIETRSRKNCWLIVLLLLLFCGNSIYMLSPNEHDGSRKILRGGNNGRPLYQ